MKIPQIKLKKRSHAFNMWFITSIFAFIQFCLQMLYAAMSDQIMLDFNIGATLTGILSSTFFYTFIFLQIPAGIILDKINLRAVISIAAAVCAIGCFIFGLSHNIYIAILGRLLMGVGSSFGFLGMTKAVRLWYRKDQFSLMVGLSELLANFAAALGIGIATIFIIRYGWRSNMIFFGVMLISLSIFSWIYLRQPDRSKKLRNYNLSIPKQIIFVLRKPQCWLTCLYAITLGAIINAFCALWGMGFIETVYGLSKELSGVGISIVFVGMAIGCPTIGMIVSMIGKVKNIMSICSLVCTLLMCAIIFPVYKYDYQWLYLLLFLLGVFTSGYFLAFEKMKHLFHESVQGIAMGICNMSLMSSALIFQPLIGYILQKSTPADAITSPQVYTSVEYQKALFVMILILIISFIISLFIKTKTELPKLKKVKL